MSANPQQVAEPKTLEEALQNMREHVARQLPPAMHARLSAAIDELVLSNPAAGSLRAGQVAPEFTLPDTAGRRFTLSEGLRTGPMIVTFYRGSWCPYCDLTLRAYSKMIPQLRQAGAQLVAISPQRADAAVPNAAEHRQLDFPVLSDAGNRVAREYGLVYSVAAPMRALFADFGLDVPSVNGITSWELPVPATFLVTPDSRIRWAYVESDYRLRAEPQRLLQALANI
jgi:peroxiredoxin